MEEKFLGKITSAKFGLVGGGSSSHLMLEVQLKFDGTTVSNRVTDLDKIRDIMLDANILDITKLVNTPVEVITDGSVLKTWRILTEVI